MEYKDITYVEHYYLETSKAIFWDMDNKNFIYYNTDAINNILTSTTVIENNEGEANHRIYKKLI
jgi:hypothetical protein